MVKRFLLTVILVIFLSVSAFAAVNINTANRAALISLSGIGPAKAAAIIKFRQDNGEFKTVENLVRVKGVGPKTLEKIKEDITVKD